MERPIIFDIDGVLARSNIPVAEYASKIAGGKIDPNEFNNWMYVRDTVQRITGSPELGEKANQGWYDANVLFLAPVTPWMQLTLKILHVIHRPHAVVTSRLAELKESTEEWFFENDMPWILDKGLLHIRENNHTGRKDFKEQRIRKLNPILYFEDELKSAQKFPHAAKLVDRAWNRDEPVNGIHRIRHETYWPGMSLAIFQQLARRK